MSALARFAIAMLAVALVWITPLLAQVPQKGQPNRGQPQAQRNAKGNGGQANNQVKIEDPRLIDLHQQFIQNVEKLATEYEKKGELEKARDCYSQILRLVPQYAPASDKLRDVRAKEAVAETKKIDIFANKEWQDTNLVVGEGKPVSISATGQWKIRIDYDLSPDGVEIPKELQAFNLGSLVGMIVTNPNATVGNGGANGTNNNNGNNAEPENPVFMVGSNHSFIAKQTGRLYLRMYDADPKDNLGKLSVEIKGSFEKPGK